VNALPPFHASSAPATASELGPSWHPGCPVGPSQLRTVTVSYVGFDGRAHVGALVVNGAVVADTEAVFRRLYAARFPIRRMEPIARYGGSDTRSMAVDNTSAFNCRYAVAPGPKRWSVHAFGEAIDVNTIENPYLEGGKVLPPAGRAYLDRARYRKGMATANGVLVRAFASVGWLWGGRWTGSPDWQHFSKTGG
jgi:D-alanyl-D-alanine carboxypeptidase